MMKKTAESFSSLCISAYECLQMYKIMCEYKIDDESGIWGRLGTILQHYWVLQIAKINDPEKHDKDYNFSLAYFVARVNKGSYKCSYNKFVDTHGQSPWHYGVQASPAALRAVRHSPTGIARGTLP